VRDELDATDGPTILLTNNDSFSRDYLTQGERLLL
jgi:hypothetical protein